MKSRPWYRRYPDNFVAGAAALTLEEKGAYSLVLDLIYARGGPIADEPRWIAGICNCSVRKWNAIRQRLIDLDKLVVEDGVLWNERALDELRSSNNQAEKLTKNGSKGGNKSAEMKAEAREYKDLVQAKLKHIRGQSTDTPIVPKGTATKRGAGYGDESDPVYADFNANVWSKRWVRNGHEPLPAFLAYAKLSEADRTACKSGIEACSRLIVANSSEERFRPRLATWINRRGWEADTGPAAPDGPDWAKWVAAYRRKGHWNPLALGPEPGQPDCRVPPEFLFGISEDAA